MLTPLIGVLCGVQCPWITDEYFGTVSEMEKLGF